MMCKYVGKIKIDMISASDWQNIFSTIQQKKHTSYSHLSDNMHRLSEMYKYFIQIGIVTENPLKDGLKLMHTAKNRRRAFTEEEKRIFLETAKIIRKTKTDEEYSQWLFEQELKYKPSAKKAVSK